MTSLRTRRRGALEDFRGHSPTTMMRSWTTPGSLLISQRIVVTQGRLLKRGGSFLMIQRSWAAFKGVWMILSSFGLWLISNVVVLFEMVLFDSNGLVWFQFFFFQISESCADISWYRSTPDSFMRFDIAQSNFEKFFPLWMVPLIARDCFWVHF